MNTGIRKVFNTIDRMESEYDVNSITYKGTRIWPLIRIYIRRRHLSEQYQQDNMPRYDQKDKKGMSEFPEFASYGRFIKAYESEWKKFHESLMEDSVTGRLKPVDIVFITNSIYSYVQVDGRSYEPIIDPSINLFSQKYSCLKLELNKDNPSKKPERHNDPVRIDHVPFFEMLRIMDSFSGKLKLRNPQDDVSGYDEFLSVLERVDETAMISKSYIANKCQVFDRYCVLFRHLFRILQPKVVFQQDYHNDWSMGLVKAAKELGIKTVDMSHGGGAFMDTTDKYHCWGRVPEGGYELIPEYFWVWGEKAVNKMKSHMPDNCPHKPVAGGLMWHVEWREKYSSKWPLSVTSRFIERMDKAEKLILMTFMGVPLDYTLDMIIEAMRRTPESWLWLLRLHPMECARDPETLEKLINQLANAGVSNYETEEATRSPLPALLERADHHVTHPSSCPLEALEFGVPSTVIGDSTEIILDSFFKSNIFGRASNAESLIERIHTAQPPKDKFIESSGELALNTLETILNGPTE